MAVKTTFYGTCRKQDLAEIFKQVFETQPVGIRTRVAPLHDDPTEGTDHLIEFAHEADAGRVYARLYWICDLTPCPDFFMSHEDGGLDSPNLPATLMACCDNRTANATCVWPMPVPIVHVGPNGKVDQDIVDEAAYYWGVFNKVAAKFGVRMSSETMMLDPREQRINLREAATYE